MPPAPPLTSFRLSPAQTRSFFADLLFGGDRGLNVEQVVCESIETLDLAVFRRSWQTMVDHHSALRVGFDRDEQEHPYQEIHSPVELPIFVEDHRQIKAAEREAFTESWLEKDRQRAFDLATPPLMRVTVLQFADNLTTWVWTFHHILLDGRSFLLVLDDFFACYEAICAGRPIALPERKHISEFIVWQHDWTEAHREEAGAYWRQTFTEDETDSVLSISRVASGADRIQKKMVLPFDVKMSDALHGLAKEYGVTVHNIMQGAWALLLSRYYRSQAVTFSTILSCRQGSVPGTEGMIGMLMNSIPVHVQIQGDMPAVDFLREIRKQQLSTRAYQWTTAEVLRSVMPTAASKQFSDSCVLYERYNIAGEMTARFGGNGARTFSLREKSNVPLLLSITEKPQIQCELIYQFHIFETEDIAQLGRSFLALLHHILEKPTAPVGTLELLDSSDKAGVIKKLSGPSVTVSGDKCLHHWFEERAKKNPQDLAIVGEITLTYEQLDRQAHELARRLVALGVTADQLVVIFLPRTALTIVAIMGVLKSGAAYFPLDVTIPKTRLNGLLEDAHASAVITEESLVRTLPPQSIPLVLLDGKQESLPTSTGPGLPRVRGSSLAYVIPTSGTTGRPKLIGVEHRQTASLLAYATQYLLQLEDVRCVPFIDSPSADSSISQIFTTLAMGGTLVLVPDILEIKSSPYYEKFTCLGTVHSLLSIILKVTGLPPSVRLIGLGAEAIPAELLERLDGIAQVKKVINYYGPTETTVYCTAAILLDRANPQNRIDLHNRGRVIGRPIANTRIYLLDDSGQMVPPGAVGEIHIAGGLVARGYLNLSARESNNFLSDRFVADAGERMYRSGDIARLRTDGQLEFHGRKDHQLKFNGVRIEAAEIENALLSYPGIRQALVDLRSEEADGKKRLVAYLVADGENFSKQKLRKVIRMLLPGAMIPQHFVVVSSFPLATNGKVDREALSRLELDPEPVGVESTPSTPTEIQMKEIFERNLSRNPIGLDQDYFELGGDSLSSVNLLLSIEKQFGIRLKPQVLLESSTIADLAREIERSTSPPRVAQPAAQEPLLSLQESGNRTPLVLIPGGSGERFLSYKNFAHGFFPDHPVYSLEAPYSPMIGSPTEAVSRLAARFAQQIINQMKGRSFVLYGHCVGGLLAWHVACALKEEKSPPFKLVLYDTPVPYKGINVTLRAPGSAPQTRWQRKVHAYRLAWIDWRGQHGDNWWAKARFVLWSVENFFMRKGLARSETGRDNFAKLTYLRTLQSNPLSTYSDNALLLYHHVQEKSVSKSLWQTHTTGEIHFEFVHGDHDDWESAIHNTIPQLRRQLAELDQK